MEQGHGIGTGSVGNGKDGVVIGVSVGVGMDVGEGVRVGGDVGVGGGVLSGVPADSGDVAGVGVVELGAGLGLKTTTNALSN